MERPKFKILKYLPAAIALGLVALITSNCTMLGLNHASLSVDKKPAPEPTLNVEALAEGSPAREALKASFETSLYGPWPRGLEVKFSDWSMVDPEYAEGRATLEETAITVGSGEGARTFHLAVAFPKAVTFAPVVISQTFSTNCAVFEGSPVSNEDGVPCAGSEMDGTFGFMAEQIFGRYIATAPVARYLDAGFAYASFYATDFVPDSKTEGPAVMAALGGEVNPTGTLMAWAFGFSAALDALEADPRIDPSRTAVMGHSRHAKAALLAGVWDRRVDAIIAHQSGFAGTALNRSATGERLDRMAKSYPHWLKAGADLTPEALAKLPVDQHQLLALLAPVPVLLGNGRRDVWSDPNSSFRAALAASPAYAARGAEGLVSDDMRAFDPEADLVWWLRPGGHSIVTEDIDAFITFLSAHLDSGAAGPIGAGTPNHGR